MEQNIYIYDDGELFVQIKLINGDMFFAEELNK